jgi:IS1 family transposase
MDWETLYCPNRRCQYYGMPFNKGLLVKNGSSHGKKQAWCKACGRRIALTYATAYYELDADVAIFELAVRALAEGNSIRATGRIVQVDKDTVCDWLNRSARQCRLVMLYFWRRLHIIECQLDELWSFVHTKEANLLGAKLLCETYGDAWVWIAFAPVWRTVIAFVVGKRTQENATLLLRRVEAVSDRHIPFFTSDQLPAYEAALLEVYGRLEYPTRQGARGRHPLPRLVPPPELLYAQVVKRRENGRVVDVTQKVVFGEAARIEALLKASPASATINTSFVERDNLTSRQHNRRLTRKTNAFSKELPWFEKQLWLSLAYYHFCLPHQSLRRPLDEPEPTRGAGSPRKWKPVTPAMEAGLTDHVWTTEELLGYRVPADFLDTLDEMIELFPDPELSIT